MKAHHDVAIVHKSNYSKVHARGVLTVACGAFLPGDGAVPAIHNDVAVILSEEVGRGSGGPNGKD